MTKLRTYDELREIDSFVERFRYLSLGGLPFQETFGVERHINQAFYGSMEWRQVRLHVIARDLGCDLGVEGFDIQASPYVHHMNPMSVTDIVHWRQSNLDPKYLITVSHKTHNAIHYGDERQLPRLFVPRSPGDTQSWGKKKG